MSDQAFYQERDGGWNVVYVNIGFLRQYASLSSEEVRLQDYMSGHGPASSRQTTKGGRVSTFGSMKTGYAAAGAPGYASSLGFKPLVTRGLTTNRPQLGEHMLKFRVGPEEAVYTLHENAIVSRSEFVRLALRHDWKEAQERCISMPEDDATAFEVYQTWLYTGTVFTNAVIDAQESDDEYGVLVRAYLLGQKLMDNDFKDTIIDAIVNKLLTTGLFDIRQTGTVYDNTPKGAPLRRLWLDIYRYQGQASWLHEELDDADISPEFLFDFSRLNLSRSGAFGTPAAPAYMNNICQYHQHNEGVCYSTWPWSSKIPAFRPSMARQASSARGSHRKPQQAQGTEAGAMTPNQNATLSGASIFQSLATVPPLSPATTSTDRPRDGNTVADSVSSPTQLNSSQNRGRSSLPLENPMPRPL